jgi:Fe2+ or Zn2+ uptake regulation protein
MNRTAPSKKGAFFMQKIGGVKRRSGTVIFDDLAFKLTPSERIIFGIIHRFSGYKLGECRLKPAAIQKLAGVSRSTVYNATKHLMDLGMVKVVRHRKANGAYFRALKVIRENLDGMAKMTGEEIESIETKVIDNGRAAFMAAPQIFIDPDYAEHEAMSELAEAIPQDAIDVLNDFGDNGVNALLEYWLQEMKTPITNRVKANRRAAWNLLKKHGQYTLRQAVQFAALAQFNEYAPSISDYVDLQSKWGPLHMWAQKRAHAKLMERFEEMSIEDRVEFKKANPELAQIISQKRKAI